MYIFTLWCVTIFILKPKKKNRSLTHLIPWPGPHAIPEMLIYNDPSLIAIQSSPNGT